MRAQEEPVVRQRRRGEGHANVRSWTSNDVLTGGIVGAIEALLAISLAGLVFAGALAPAAGTMIGMALVGTAVVLLVVAYRTSLPVAVGSTQETPAAILAVVTAGVASQLGPDHPGLVGTAIVSVVTATTLTGAMLWVLGRFQVGQLARYVPYPVIGGFLAGTGWLLFAGGLDFLVADDPGLLTSATWTDPAILLKMLPGVLLAAGLLLGARRGLGGALLPAVAFTAVGAFYLVVLVGPGLDAVRDGGWLLGPFRDRALWPPEVSLFAEVDLAAVAGQGITIVTVAALSAVSLLLMASGIELSAGEDADLDRELKVAGGANLLVAATGGLPGYHAVLLSDLVRRAGADNRRVSLVAAVVVLLGVVIGGGPIALLPRFVAGGLLAFLGLVFLTEWLIDGWSTLDRADYAIVVSIVVVIAGVGFLEGVAVGLLLSFLRFLVTYSRTEVVRTRRRGSATPSRVDRPARDQALLETVADRIVVLELQGFLFFGTGHQLAEEVRSILLDDPHIRHVILDLERVTGADSTAVQSLQRIARRAAAADATLVLVGLSAERSRALDVEAFAAHEEVRVADDLDQAVQWCEERLLAEATPADTVLHSSLRDDLEAELGDQELIARLLAVVEHVEVPAGTRVIRRGDTDHDLYLLEAGQLTVSLPGEDDRPVRVRTMTAGTVIGEIGLELGVPRSADVVADTDVRLLRLPATTLERLAVQDPLLAAAVHRYLARLLARRLITSLRTIEALER